MSDGPRTSRRDAAPTGAGKWARVLMVYLHTLPRTGLFLAVLALVLAGLFLPGVVGAILLLVLIVAFIALLSVSWPRLPWGRRVIELFALALLLAVVVDKLR